jgi:hypothetical protein
VLLESQPCISKNKISISVGYGAPSVVRTFLKINNKDKDYKIIGYGPYMVKADYMLTKKWSIGLNFSYSFSRLSWMDDGWDSTIKAKRPYEYGVEAEEFAGLVRSNYHFYNKNKIDLINIMPILQNLGVYVFDELTTRIGTPETLYGYIHSFRLANLDGSKIDEKQLANEFNFESGISYYKMLTDNINGLNDSWAVRWYASIFLKNMNTLFPSKSFVKNIGVDDSGVHCSYTTVYDTLVNFHYKKLEKNHSLESLSDRLVVQSFFRKIKYKRYLDNVINKIKKFVK